MNRKLSLKENKLQNKNEKKENQRERIEDMKGQNNSGKKIKCKIFIEFTQKIPLKNDIK